MSGNLIVGFAPAAAGGAGSGVTGFVAAGEPAEGPLGLFGALLGAATLEEPSAIEYAATGQAALEAAPTGLLDAALPLGVEFSLEAPVEPEVDGKALLADLVDALATLEQALANGEPVDPALPEQISEALDALSALLDIPLPVAPLDPPNAGPEPAETSPLPTGSDLDALLALAGEVIPALQGESLFTAAPDTGAPATPPSALAAPTAPAAADTDAPPLASPPPVADDVVMATTPGANPLLASTHPTDEPAARPTPDPAPVIGQLVKKLTQVAESMAPHSPGLAKRLEALADRLTAGVISAETLAKLGIDTGLSLAEDELGQALDKLLGATSEVKGTPAPPAYAVAQLKLPEVIALPPKAETPRPTETPSLTAPAAPEIAAENASAPDPRPTLAEPRAAEPQAKGRDSFADSLRATPGDADMPAEPGTHAQSTTQAATAPAAAVVAGTKAIHAAYRAPVHQINVPQVAFEVVRQVQAGNSRFQIRLDPPELGRIDVRLDVDQSGNVNARMTVERAETLDLMQRDQRALERALAQAGLDSSKTNLEFSLRQNPFGREDGGDGRGKGSPFGGGGETADLGESAPEVTQTLYRGSTSASGVNLFV